MEIKLIILSLALILDRVVGDPPQLWHRLPHPVVLFGKAISWGEKRFNDRTLPEAVLRRNGMWLTIALVAACIRGAVRLRGAPAQVGDLPCAAGKSAL